MKKCRLFHDWELSVNLYLSNDIGWIYLDCQRCGKSKNKITNHYWADCWYYWGKQTINRLSKGLL